MQTSQLSNYCAQPGDLCTPLHCPRCCASLRCPRCCGALRCPRCAPLQCRRCYFPLDCTRCTALLCCPRCCEPVCSTPPVVETRVKREEESEVYFVDCPEEMDDDVEPMPRMVFAPPAAIGTPPVSPKDTKSIRDFSFLCPFPLEPNQLLLQQLFQQGLNAFAVPSQYETNELMNTVICLCCHPAFRIGSFDEKAEGVFKGNLKALCLLTHILRYILHLSPMANSTIQQIFTKPSQDAPFMFVCQDSHCISLRVKDLRSWQWNGVVLFGFVFSEFLSNGLWNCSA